MSQVTQENTTPTHTERLAMLGTCEVRFYFPVGTQSQTVTAVLQDVPFGVKKATIAIKGFNADYAHNDSYGLGQFSVDMYLDEALVNATCSICLVEHKHSREWHGSATGIVTFYG